MGPIVMVREPLFQIHMLGMNEDGIRERPFGSKTEAAKSEDGSDEGGQSQGDSVKAEVVSME